MKEIHPGLFVEGATWSGNDLREEITALRIERDSYKKALEEIQQLAAFYANKTISSSTINFALKASTLVDRALNP